MLIQTLTGYFELKDNFTKHSHLQITFLKDKKPKQTNKTNKNQGEGMYSPRLNVFSEVLTGAGIPLGLQQMFCCRSPSRHVAQSRPPATASFRVRSAVLTWWVFLFY